ncbi:putative ABC transporter related [Nostocoides japonicum T1-X7]|uniref:Putative ABC transporter related n=1 Tax=Nostocoides japonicum T1-X7 TaxID=1194083 RepID=A0A077M4R5_9MICO|nr:cysteine peptidase family C39 domain-containing protein [Tetrasphaera japonica]CCH79094.1 putative ABC transporter related [Tetrasphaera japonica T1-X7]
MKTPHVPQLSDVDCGPACLTAVLAAHGRHVRVAEVARACATGRDGTTTASLVRAARGYGLTARPFRRTPGDDAVEALAAGPLPAVTLMRGHHFVVAESTGTRGVRVNDPGHGHRTMPASEFAQEWTGLGVRLTAGADFAPGGTPPEHPVRSWWREEDRGSRWLCGTGALFAAIAAAASFAAVLVVRGVAGAGPVSPDRLPTVLAGLALVCWLSGWLGAHLRSRMLHHTVIHRATRLVHHLLRVSPSFLQFRFTGEVAMRPQRIDGAAMQIVALLVDGAVGLLTVTAALAGIAVVSPAAFALVLAGLGANAYAIGHHLDDYREAHGRAVAGQQARDGEIVATLAAIETMRSEASPTALADRWAASQRRVAALERRAHLFLLRRTRFSLLVDGATTGLVVVVAGSDGVPPALVLVLLLLTGLALTAGRRVITLGAFDVTQVRTALRLVEDVTLEPAEGVLVPPGGVSDGLELTGVSFTRPGAREPLFAGVDLAVAPGATCFVVGASGVGKSTLVRVAVGALTPTTGRVARPGRVAYVPQRALFLEGTVAANVTLGADLPDALVDWALDVVGMSSVVAARGGPAHAPVTQGARNFSGGERQRLALARALVRRPRLLVLDEAFSGMDDRLTDLLHARLRLLGIAVLAVAHHLPRLGDRDRVVRLEPSGLTLEYLGAGLCTAAEEAS